MTWHHDPADPCLTAASPRWSSSPAWPCWRSPLPLQYWGGLQPCMLCYVSALSLTWRPPRWESSASSSRPGAQSLLRSIPAARRPRLPRRRRHCRLSRRASSSVAAGGHVRMRQPARSQRQPRRSEEPAAQPTGRAAATSRPGCCSASPWPGYNFLYAAQCGLATLLARRARADERRTSDHGRTRAAGRPAARTT